METEIVRSAKQKHPSLDVKAANRKCVITAKINILISEVQLAEHRENLVAIVKDKGRPTLSD